MQHETAPDRTAPQPKRPAAKTIGRSLRQAIHMLVSGEVKTIKAAAERSGLSVGHLSRCLGLPHVEAYIAQQTRRTIAAGQMRASARLLELIDASSEHVSLDASRHTLAIVGIRPADDAKIVNNISVLPGYVIDLASAPVVEVTPVDDAPHTLSDDSVCPDDDDADH